MSAEKPIIDYAAILADLEAKKAAIESLIASFRIAAASGALVMGELSSGAGTFSAPTQTIGSIHDIPNGAFHGKSITEASKSYLGMIKKKQTTREIAEALLRGGMETTSDRFQTNVHGILLRASKDKGEIVRIGNAWGLADWYPSGLRANVSAEKKQAKKQKPKKSSARKDAKAKSASSPNGATKNNGAGPVSATGLNQRVFSLLAKSFPDGMTKAAIVEHVNDVLPQAVYLTLGRLKAAKQVELDGEKYRAIISS